jgi:hypothetical protein
VQRVISTLWIGLCALLILALYTPDLIIQNVLAIESKDLAIIVPVGVDFSGRSIQQHYYKRVSRFDLIML